MHKTLDNGHLQALVTLALTEDIGDGDISAALIPAEHLAEASIICRENAIFCGKPWANEVFRQIDPDVVLQWKVNDGDAVAADTLLVTLRGRARSLLSGERAALNFLQTLSGTATRTRKFVDALAQTQITLLDTRKTLPGFREAQKYAVRCGGGSNHRMGLFDAFLIKENHIAAAGGIRAAIQAARTLHTDRTLEVEVENLDEFAEALDCAPDIIMLDNFDGEQRKQAFAMLDTWHATHPDANVQIEISGGIDIDNVPIDIANRPVFISSGSLTKHIQAIDLSMRVKAC